MDRNLSRNEKDDWVEDGPSISKNQWFACAMLFGALTFILFAYVAFRVLFQSGLGSIDAMIITRTGGVLLAFGGAATTFFTVLYRTKITEEQVAQARRQNDSNDEAEMALLLDKAHQQIKSEDLGDKALGITMFETVALAENGKYARYALSAIGQQLKHAYGFQSESRTQLERQFKAFYKELSLKGYRERLPSGEMVEIAFPHDLDPQPIVNVFTHMPPCMIDGAAILVGSHTSSVINNLEIAIEYLNCEFRPILPPATRSIGGLGERWEEIESVDGRHRGCTFVMLAIGEIWTHRTLFTGNPKTKFFSCNLSNTRFSDAKTIEDCIFKDCYYSDAGPPGYMDENKYRKWPKQFLIDKGIFYRA